MLMEEEELGQLGALEAALDSSTEFGRRAAYRLTSRKHFVKMDCSRRYMRAQCRNAGTMPLNVRVGDMLMYKKEQGSSGAPGDNWCGPLRVLGVDDKTLWGLHEGVPIACATNKVRSANVSEILAHTILKRGKLQEPVREGDPNAQRTMLDLRDKPEDQQQQSKKRRTAREQVSGQSDDILRL